MKTLRWTLAVALLAGCVPASEAGSYYSDDGPRPETRFEDTSEIPETSVRAEDSEPVPSMCEQLVVEAPRVPDTLDVPGPYSVEYHTEPDPRLEAIHNGPVLGEVTGFTIRVWPDLHESDEELAFTILHELGHVIDHECLTLQERRVWMQLRDLDGEWVGDDPILSPHEDFAESFGFCLTERDDLWHPEYGNPPTPGRCQVLTRLVESGF